MLKYFFSEPFLEAVPQVLVLICISYLSGIPLFQHPVVGLSEGGYIDCQANNCGIATLKFNKRTWNGTGNWEFMGTFLLSLCSCCFGMSRFLKNGPMTLVPRNKYGASFFAILPTVTASIFGKGVILGCLVAFSDLSEDRSLIAWSVPIWFGFCLLPHFVYVSTINLRYFLLEKLLHSQSRHNYLPPKYLAKWFSFDFLAFSNWKSKWIVSLCQF